jgi:hypothetical protein
MTPAINDTIALRALASRKFDREQRKRELCYRQTIAARHRPTTWPLDALTLQPAEWIEPGDVCMPAPPEPPPLEHYKQQAETPGAHLEVNDINLEIARFYERKRERDHLEALRGTVWTIAIVDERLTAAFRVSLSWKREYPREFGSMMPRSITQLSDLVSQAENHELTKLMSRLLRHKPAWSAQDEQRAREAIAWPLDYLSNAAADVALCVNAGAWWRALRLKVRDMCDDHGLAPATFYRKRAVGLACIVAGLTADGRAPT